MHTISVKSLSKQYGREMAVNSVSFHLEPGQVLGVVGPNGSGKTTLFGMILGLRSADSGEIEVFGESDIQNVKHRIGIAMDQGSFYKSFSASRNLQLSAIAKGVSLDRIPGVLERVSLSHTGKKAYSKFSYGMKKRLEIADAMLSDPDLYVLDEPTNGLDPEGIIFIRELINDLRSQGKTVIVSSHYLLEIEKVCTDLLMMRRGQTVFFGPLAEAKEKFEDLESLFITKNN
jgi:ABC-2 type transport system ATP-binding protein